VEEKGGLEGEELRHLLVWKFEMSEVWLSVSARTITVGAERESARLFWGGNEPDFDVF
jgi:hypothetical protein